MDHPHNASAPAFSPRMGLSDFPMPPQHQQSSRGGHPTHAASLPSPNFLDRRSNIDDAVALMDMHHLQASSGSSSPTASFSLVQQRRKPSVGTTAAGAASSESYSSSLPSQQSRSRPTAALESIMGDLLEITKLRDNASSVWDDAMSMRSKRSLSESGVRVPYYSPNVYAYPGVESSPNFRRVSPPASAPAPVASSVAPGSYQTVTLLPSAFAPTFGELLQRNGTRSTIFSSVMLPASSPYYSNDVQRASNSSTATATSFASSSAAAAIAATSGLGPTSPTLSPGSMAQKQSHVSGAGAPVRAVAVLDCLTGTDVVTSSTAVMHIFPQLPSPFSSPASPPPPFASEIPAASFALISGRITVGEPSPTTVILWDAGTGILLPVVAPSSPTQYPFRTVPSLDFIRILQERPGAGNTSGAASISDSSFAAVGGPASAVPTEQDEEDRERERMLAHRLEYERWAEKQQRTQPQRPVLHYNQYSQYTGGVASPGGPSSSSAGGGAGIGLGLSSPSSGHPSGLSRLSLIGGSGPSASMADMLRGRRPSADSVLTKDSYGMWESGGAAGGGGGGRYFTGAVLQPQGYSAAAAAGKLPQSSQSQQLAASYSSSGKASGSGRSQGSGGGGTGPRSPGGGTAVFGGHTSDDHKSVSSGGSGGHSGDHERGSGSGGGGGGSSDKHGHGAGKKLGKVLTWGKSKSAGPGSAGATPSGASIIHVGGGSPGSIISGIGKKPVETEQEREARMKREAKMIKERAYAVFM